MEQVIWNILKPIISVVCIGLGALFAIKGFQAYKNDDEHAMWKNAIGFFIFFGIAYRIEDFVELVKNVWDKIPIIAGG